MSNYSDTIIIEREHNQGIPYEGSGLIAAGIDGSTSAAALLDRQSRVAEFQERLDYREVVPCEKCSNCIELRGFTPNGTDVCTGHFCTNGCFEVKPNCTCNSGRLSKRLRIIYSMRNAPPNFGLRPGDRDITSEETAKTTEKRKEKRDYIGGSGHYQRADGKSVAEGAGMVPRRLMN